MLEGLWYGIAAAFIFIGVVATAYFVILQVLRSGEDVNCVVVVPADVEDDDIGALLYSLNFRLSLIGECCRSRIVVVDKGMNRKQKTLCQNIIKDFDNIEICSPDDLTDIVIRKDE